MLGRFGKIEQQILKHLALHPRQNMQVIQRALNIPGENYPSVRHAILSLKKSGLVKSEPATSKKDVPIRIWHLTDEGVFTVFKNATDLSSEDLNLVIDNYVLDSKTKDFVNLIHQELGTQFTLRLLNLFVTVKSLDKIGDSGFMQSLMGASLMKGLSKEENMRLGKLLEKIMNMDAKTKILLKMMKRMGMFPT